MRAADADFNLKDKSVSNEVVPMKSVVSRLSVRPASLGYGGPVPSAQFLRHLRTGAEVSAA